MNEETAFPRGGHSRRNTKDEGETKKKKKSRKRSVPPKDDFLFGSSQQDEFHASLHKKPKTSSSSATTTTAISMLPLGGGAVLAPNKKREALIESISFSRISKGTKFLAMVRSVQEDYAVLSLPNMLNGYVLKNAKDKFELTDMLRQDQILAVSVIKTATEQVGGGVTRRRIQLSVMPSVMNSTGTVQQEMIRGQVLSIEDHGCLVDVGHGRRGFVKFSNVHQDYTLDTSSSDDGKLCLNPGRILDFQTMPNTSGSASASVVSLSIPQDYAKLKVSQSNTTLASLAPGTLVEARVEALARNGLCVTFWGGVFRGSIELGHLGCVWIPKNKDGSSEWKHLFGKSSKIKKIKARIICVDAATKIVRLTLLPHLLNLEKPPSLPSVGTVLENATVVRLDPGVGALLALPTDEEDEMDTDEEEEDNADKSSGDALAFDKSYQKACKVRTTYVHISKSMDNDGDDDRTSDSVFAKHFCPSSIHAVRILNTHHILEGVATGATARSIVDAHVLTHDDLQPSKVYRNVPVKSHLAGGGVIVDFGMGVCGLIPPQHLFDTVASTDTQYRAKLVKQRFAVGHKVNVRVLEVNSDSKRCILTAKKSLVTSRQEPITSFDKVQKGQLATGFISSLDSKALHITFYNKVYGRVTAKSLAAELGIENLEENYSVGSVVQCRVINCVNKKKTEHERDYWELHLSLKLEGPILEEKKERKEGEKFRLQSGVVLPPKCMKIVELVKCKQRETGGFIPGYAVVSIKSKHFLNDDDDASSIAFVECKLPFDQLVDSYPKKDANNFKSLDALAHRLLRVGKKINQPGLVMLHPKEREDGKSPLPVVSLRSKLIETATESEESKVLLPSRDTNLVVGAYVQGYVTRLDPRHGAFVRFLDGVTGLVPKVKKGLELPLFETIICKVVALDVSQRPMKILLKKARDRRIKKKTVVRKETEETDLPNISVGDTISDVEVTDVSFAQAKVKILDVKLGNVRNIRARIHVTMGDSISIPSPTSGKKKKQKSTNDHSSQRITKFHPFFKWQIGMKLADLTCASVEMRNGIMYIELTNRKLEFKSEDKDVAESRPPAFCVKKSTDMVPGQMVSAIVTFVPKHNRGLWVHVCPGVIGYVPAMELSADVKVLNNLRAFYPVGARIDCCVMDKSLWNSGKKPQNSPDGDATKTKSPVPSLSSLLFKRSEESTNENPHLFKPPKPLRGELIVGRINRSFPMKHSPSLMLDLRGGFVGRCCVTELEEVDEWGNMPLGRAGQRQPNNGAGTANQNIVTDEEDHEEEEGKDQDENGGSEDDDGVDEEEEEKYDNDEDPVSGHHSRSQYGQYPEGKYVQCRVLAGIPSTPYVEVSLRPSRIEGDLDDDKIPEENVMVQAYVIDTNKKGCFVRLSRQVEGRVTLKEIADGFIPDPAVMFPMGRLVVGKVKAVKANKDGKSKKSKKKRKDPVRANVDLDMRESTLLESKDKLQIDDVKVGSKHKGIVTRIESYGVFVRLDNSSISGLVHKSECSDDYVKDLAELYDPGDLVKVLVVKADIEQKRIGLSMKASHFEDDEDSDDSSIDSSMELEDDELDSESEDEEMAEGVVSGSEEELDSDDEDFASKLAAKLDAKNEGGEKNDSSCEDSDSDDSSDSGDEDSDDEGSDEDDGPTEEAMDTDVGFNWGAGVSSSFTDKKAGSVDEDASSDEDSDEDDEDEGISKSTHKSRKKSAARRREEQEIARRETALADGTADKNPETTADFERLLASEPNTSVHWIRYMAYHLSLADVQSARSVAERAFNRIEFRQEEEKLNVWTALLTLELKYGSQASLQETIDRACQHNNPKKVYLRVCEMLEKDIDAATTPTTEATVRADEMFAKMCKKFKSKKTVWIEHLKYLLKSGRHQEAHALLKRALTSLPEYKHVETMSKFAQLEFEHGSAERGRTIFDGVLQKYPKRLDLLYVYVDKEVKIGEIDAARALFERTVHSDKRKLSDKQMKSLFKKWYRMEETHGTDENRESVKNAARDYVERSSK